MSVRAYKIEKIETKNDPTFNLWHDDLILDAIPSINDSLNADSCGVVYIPLGEAKEAVKSIRDVLKDKTLEKEKREEYKEQLENARKLVKECAKNEGAEYYCY